MLAKLPNLTDTSISRLVQKSSSRPQHLQRALSTSHINRNHTNASVQSNYKPLVIQLRENQLQWMFNRRKQKLLETSVQNFRLYNRIKAQKSQLAKYNRNKSRLLGSRVKTQGVDCLTDLNSMNNIQMDLHFNMNGSSNLNMTMKTNNLMNFQSSKNQERHQQNKENIQISNFIKKKQENIKRLLLKNTQKQWRRYHSTHLKNI